MADKPQFKFYAEPHLIERLDRCAAQVGAGSAQQFVIEALEDYAELLVDLLLEKRDQEELLRKRQREQLLSRNSQSQESGRSRRK